MKFCAALSRTRHAQSMVFDLLRPDRQRPSFDVYFDFSIAELVSTVETAKTNVASLKKSAGARGQQKKKQLIRDNYPRRSH